MSDRLLLRYWYPSGRLQAALPLHSVEKSAARTAGWLLVGSDISYWSTAEGRDPRSVPLQQRFRQELTTAPRRWEGADVLRVLPVGRPYQVLHFFDHGTFLGWYINFEAPARWNGNVADTRDWHLDLTVSPDGQGEWKDEDEAAVAVQCGLCTLMSWIWRAR